MGYYFERSSNRVDWGPEMCSSGGGATSRGSGDAGLGGVAFEDIQDGRGTEFVCLTPTTTKRRAPSFSRTDCAAVIVEVGSCEL